MVLPWVGDRGLGTLTLLLAREGLQVSADGFSIIAEGVSPSRVAEVLEGLTASTPPEPEELAKLATNRRTEKFHSYLSDSLLVADYASSRLDVPTAWRAVERILAGRVD